MLQPANRYRRRPGNRVSQKNSEQHLRRIDEYENEHERDDKNRYERYAPTNIQVLEAAIADVAYHQHAAQYRDEQRQNADVPSRYAGGVEHPNETGDQTGAGRA